MNAPTPPGTPAAPAANADPRYYELFRHELLPLVDRAPVRVLDIGCGTGRLLRHFRHQGAAFAAGVEIVPAVADAARAAGGLDAVHALDIETTPLPYPPGHFDTLVMSHVLEHLRDPWRTLPQVLQVLAPGGALLGAMPNVRHWPVLRDLALKGRFEYADSGVMDRTHLRFFTRRSIVALLEGAGLRVERLEPEIGGPKSRLLSRLSFGAMDDIACYAYNFRARKPEA